MRRFSCEKLVRDNALAIFKSYGIHPKYKRIAQEELIRALKNKLIEEAKEVVDATTTEDIIEELADLQEVIESLVLTLKISKSDIEQKQLNKKSKEGGFLEGLYVSHIDIPTHSPRLKHFLNQPHKYAELVYE